MVEKLGNIESAHLIASMIRYDHKTTVSTALRRDSWTAFIHEVTILLITDS
jgi:hypothetical protein